MHNFSKDNEIGGWIKNNPHTQEQQPWDWGNEILAICKLENLQGPRSKPESDCMMATYHTAPTQVVPYSFHKLPPITL